MKAKTIEEMLGEIIIYDPLLTTDNQILVNANNALELAKEYSDQQTYSLQQELSDLKSAFTISETSRNFNAEKVKYLQQENERLKEVLSWIVKNSGDPMARVKSINTLNNVNQK